MLGNIKVMCRGSLHTCFDTGILVAINKPKNAVLEVNDMRIKCEMVKKSKYCVGVRCTRLYNGVLVFSSFRSERYMRIQ